ncbi:MAG: hypothetical protein U0838_14790 [Chloroflexota bacterium]
MTAGTEHNTPERIPLEPFARGGAPIPDEALDIFFGGACVVAATRRSERRT